MLASEIGQVVAFANKVLAIQPRRQFVYGLLTDYHQVQFFRVEHQGENLSYKKVGWDRLVTLISQGPSELGWIESELTISGIQIRLERYLGAGRTAIVYEGVSDNEHFAVKVFKGNGDYKDQLEQEVAVLAKFADMKHKKHFSSLIAHNNNVIITQPVCEKIHYWQKTDVEDLLATLQEVHESGVCHQDLQKCNIMRDCRQGLVVILDWGYSVNKDDGPQYFAGDVLKAININEDNLLLFFL